MGLVVGNGCAAIAKIPVIGIVQAARQVAEINPHRRTASVMVAGILLWVF
jgi:hypothetical protein